MQIRLNKKRVQIGYIPEMKDPVELCYFSLYLHLTPLLLSTSLLFRNFYNISGEFLSLYRGGELSAVWNGGCSIAAAI
jgi:hypothetical protein